MSGSVNKIIIIGHMGSDPERRNMGHDKSVVSFSVATSDSWKDRDGQKQEKTIWHRVSIFSEGLGNIAMQYLHKGSQVYIEGKQVNGSYEKDGQKINTSEVHLNGFNSTLTMLDSRSDGSGGGGESKPPANNGSNKYAEQSSGTGSGGLPMSDDIPFFMEWR